MELGLDQSVEVVASKSQSLDQLPGHRGNRWVKEAMVHRLEQKDQQAVAPAQAVELVVRVATGLARALALVLGQGLEADYKALVELGAEPARVAPKVLRQSEHELID